MGLSWISPLYLAGALLLALPVLIHLVQRHRSSGIKFPSLMFLRRIPLREKRRLEIRHWLLLLLRCLLLLLIVLAFARPFLVGESESGNSDPGRRDSVIVIDRSYSMQIANHWQQAQEIALNLVNQKAGLDRMAVVVFDENTEVLSDLTANADDLSSVIRRQSPGLRTTRLRLGLEQAARLLASSSAVEKQILLISDFQTAGAAASGVPVISRDFELRTFAIDVAEVANAAISSFAITPAVGGAADEYSLEVEVTNHAASVLDQQIGVALNGRELPRRNLRLEPGAVTVVSFDDLSLSGNLVRGVVSLRDDALALDNQAFFVYSSKQQLPVLIVEGAQAHVNQSIYLENALRLSQDPGFRITRLRWDELKPEDLTAWAVIIVNDARIPGGAIGKALQNFVTNGGGLLVASGDQVGSNWPSGEAGLLPGSRLRQVDSKPGEAHRIQAIVSDHPLAKLAATRKQIDLSSARVFHYQNLIPDTTDRVLARYGDGGVALLEKTLGQGRVLVLTTTLDTRWNDLVLQPVFLPFLHQTLRYLAAFESYPRGTEIGEVVDVMVYARGLAGADAIVAAADDSTLVVETPSTREIRLSRKSPLVTITEPGFYQVHRATPANADVVLAANINPHESNPEILDVKQFEEEIRASAETLPAEGLLTRRQAAEYEQQQQLWYAVLSLVLVLMLVEAFSANWVVRNWSVRD